MPFDLGYPPSQFRSPRPGYNGTSLQDVARRFPTDEACFAHVMEQRLGADPACPQCGKRGKWYRRRGAQYVQRSCGAVVSPLAGTVFNATKLPLRLWFYAMLHFANSSEGVNAGFLARQLGITYPAAFRMAQKIRHHMAMLERQSAPVSMGAVVHARLDILDRVRTGPYRPNAVNVLFAAAPDRVDCNVMTRAERHTVRAALTDMMPGHGPLLTTCQRTANVLAAYGMRRPLATLVPDFFKDHPAERDLITGFLRYFIWPFRNHYKQASREHVWLYLKEFQFRYNRRHRAQDTYWDMVSSFPPIGAGPQPSPGPARLVQDE